MQQQQDDNQVQDGSDNALFDRYGSVIFAYLRSHARSREEAEDLTLEAFTAALEYNDLAGLADTERLAWLRRVARNKLVDHYRYSNHHAFVALEQAEAVYNDDALSPEQVALQQEKYSQLYAAVRKLPQLQQQVLRLRYGNGLRFAEIGGMLNKREEAVRKLLSRALTTLRSIYDQQQGENEL